MLIETNIYGQDIKFQLIPIEGTYAKQMSIKDNNKTHAQMA